MKSVAIALTICFVIVGCAFADINLKAGYFFNWQDGEQKPVVATTLKQLQLWVVPLDFDLWATDLDAISDGLASDWQGGLALNYMIPNDIEGLELSIGYGVGARRPLDDEIELIHGGLAFGLNFKF